MQNKKKTNEICAKINKQIIKKKELCNIKKYKNYE